MGGVDGQSQPGLSQESTLSVCQEAQLVETVGGRSSRLESEQPAGRS